MRFLTMIKMSEQAGPPPAALLEAMGKEIEQGFSSGTLVDTGGLAPSAAGGVRIRRSGGRTTVVDGPFTEARELVGGYAILRVDSREDAVEAARRIVKLHEDHWPGWEGESEVRQIVEG